jgi:hypothetical protein
LEGAQNACAFDQKEELSLSDKVHTLGADHYEVNVCKGKEPVHGNLKTSDRGAQGRVWKEKG